MLRLLAVVAALAAPSSFHASSHPLPRDVRTQLRRGGFWHEGCPVALSGLRVLNLSYRDRAQHRQAGQLIVNAHAVAPLTRTFSRLYALHFDRSRHRPMMVTRAVVRAFAASGWGWGGAWAGSTKDYMHFSATGH